MKVGRSLLGVSRGRKGAVMLVCVGSLLFNAACVNSGDASSADTPVDSPNVAPTDGAPENWEIPKWSPTPTPSPSPTPTPTNGSAYPVHSQVISTVFWVGEGADASNGYISNAPSAWDEQWLLHYGGVDDPSLREGYFPAAFTPLENPFYVALPYNDFDSSGMRRSNASSVIYWANGKTWANHESMCKNRWVRITKGSKTAYAQWEDVGPYLEDDAAYVFGTAAPKNTNLSKAGIDLSPAVKDYLGAADVDRVNWQFVDDADVPAGPWKQVVTVRQIYWQ